MDTLEPVDCPECLTTGYIECPSCSGEGFVQQKEETNGG